MSRYARQIAVDGFGGDAQNRIASARILVIGAGGLAAPVLQYLVGAGVGHITLVDADAVSLSNLHRQTVFTQDDIDQPKVLAAKARLEALNSDVVIEAVQSRFEPSNAADLCADMDLILDCADSFAASYVASDFCVQSNQALISASIVGRDGYVGGFCKNVPSLRAVFPDLPDRLGSCDADGVIGSSVGVIGSLQAEMALAVLSGASNPLGRLISYDAAAMRFGGFSFEGAPEPKAEPGFISVDQIQSGDFVIDLRAEGEAGPAINSTARHQVSDFKKDGPMPDADTRAVLACRSGLRAWQAAERLTTYWDGEIKLLALGD